MTDSERFFISFTAIVTVAIGSTFGGTYSGGTGEPNNPYLIATAADMNEIGANPADWGSHFLLVNDVNLAAYTGTQFRRIGGLGPGIYMPFTGVFNGNDHTIFNFTYSTPGSDGWGYGLFALVDDANAVIKKLNLINVNINSGSNGLDVGALIGRLGNGNVTNCHADGISICGVMGIGGLIGHIVGTTGTVFSCSASGNVIGHDCVGGLIGFTVALPNPIAMPVSNCSADCNVTGNRFVGGLVGQNGSGNNANGGLIFKCFAKGSVKGNYRLTGGLIGWNSTQGTISNCYAMNNVDGNDVTGGLVGGTGSGIFGGTTISNCYSSGSVTGNTSTGGLIGNSNPADDITGCFWDMNTSGQNTSAGGEGKTSVEMQKESTFADAGWDFVEVWDIGEKQTYPFLRKYTAGDLNHDGIVNFLDVAILAGHWLE